MKKYETYQRLETRQRCIERVCDLCGRKAVHEEWTDSCYEIDDTEFEIAIRHQVGMRYPEGGQQKTVEVDICPTCFRDKLIPWLRSQGATITEQDVDW